MPKTKKKYVVTFGKHHYETKHVFLTKGAATKKARSLKKNLPLIGFQVKEKKK